jgi:Phosphodiester glycosidase
VPPSTVTRPSSRRPSYLIDHVRADWYDRFQISNQEQSLVAQVLRVPSARLSMSVREDQAVMELDFRRTVTRPDLVGAAYRERPGYHLTDVLGELRSSESSAILFNGNNVGWWGNQFVIRRKQLRFKPKGPIFDDGDLPTHVSGLHAFLLPGSPSYQIVDIKLHGTKRESGDTSEMDLRALRPLPRCGLSGFPLIRHGRPVWEQHGEKAWDPGLLFDLGASRMDGHGVISEFVRVLIKAGEQLVRHPMTVIGLDETNNVVLLVVEKSHRSRGMNVAEAARLLRRRFAVRDAIVLGAAGDAQLATTLEGFLTVPLVAPYARDAARPIPDDMLSSGLGNAVSARPVPCYVVLRPSVPSRGASTRPPSHTVGMNITSGAPNRHRPSTKVASVNSSA